MISLTIAIWLSSEILRQSIEVIAAFSLIEYIASVSVLTLVNKYISKLTSFHFKNYIAKGKYCKTKKSEKKIIKETTTEFVASYEKRVVRIHLQTYNRFLSRGSLRIDSEIRKRSRKGGGGKMGGNRRAGRREFGRRGASLELALYPIGSVGVGCRNVLPP